MTCEERKDLLLLHALGALDSAQEAEVRAHLSSGCVVCEAALAQANALVSLLPLSLPPVAPPPAARERLMQRIAASGAAAPAAGRADATAPAPAQPAGGVERAGRAQRTGIGAANAPVQRMSRYRWVRPALLGAIAASVLTALGFYTILLDQRRLLRARNDQALRLQEQVRDLRASVRDADETVHFIESPAVKVVLLEGAPAQPGARGRLFWNAGSGALRFFASGMHAPPAGQAYELWLINDQQKKIPAGMFSVDAHGEGAMSYKIDGPAGALAAVAVTNEPAGALSPQPTGSFQMISAAK